MQPNAQKALRGGIGGLLLLALWLLLAFSFDSR